MALQSYSFIFIFFPVVATLYWIANCRSLYNAGKMILLISSLTFYALLSPGIKGLAALLLSVLFCYVVATFGLRAALSQKARKMLLAAGVSVNILFLVYCRYLSYIGQLVEQAGGASLTFEAVVVPVGISYFTFSQIAFLVDTYRDPGMKYSFPDYLLFVSFFPKITMGPIALTTEMIPMFNETARKKIDHDKMARGFYRFTLGLGKKLIIADNLGPFVDLAYQNIPNLSTWDAILTILSYTMQLYFDFSGYCDMASGMCDMLGLGLCENFDGPYHSLSLTEFWKRWHISLTKFFRNYLYIPMGGNRKGKFRTYMNNLFIFLVSGLWHGAATHFVIWGAVHGIGIIISRLISPVTSKIPKPVRWFTTFSFVNLAWVFFRADDTEIAIKMFERLFTGGFASLNVALISTAIPAEFKLLQYLIVKNAPDYTFIIGSAIWILLVVIAVYFSVFTRPAGQRCREFTASRKKAAATVIIFTWSVLSLSEVAEFLYVNF